jgi:glutamate racemase
MKILVYDSGVGGRSVYQLIETHIKENNLSDIQLSYFADTKNYPYGTKSKEELKKIVNENVKNFKAEGFEKVVVACNTASSVIAKDPNIITIIEPTVQAVKKKNPHAVFVIASTFTARTQVYSKALDAAGVVAAVVEHPEQRLINAIEANRVENIRTEVARIVREAPEDHLFLWGCTHFSLVKEIFFEEIKNQGKTFVIVDPAEELAKRCYSEFLEA